MRTYIIEDHNNVIAGMSRTLGEAKRICLVLSEKSLAKFTILAIRGQYFGEGFHKYRLELTNGKFKKVKT